MMVSHVFKVSVLRRAPAAVTPGTAGVCRPIKPHHRRSVVSCSSSTQPQRSQAPQTQQQSRPTLRLPQLVAGCGAAVMGLLGPLLPSWALDSFALDSFATDTSIDPGLGDSPPLLDTLLVVVITYFTVMLLYLWLSSFMEGGDASSAQDSSQAPPGEDSSSTPPGYGTFLDAHVRSYVGPGSKQVTALRDLGQAEPLEGEDMSHLKNRLAAGAAEALELQLRDCERLVRSKLLARKLGYAPQPHKAADGSNGSLRSARERDSQIEEMMLAAVMTAPEGLGSWQHRAAVEALIEQQLSELLPPGGGQFHEDLIVRQVMRRVVQALVMEESLLLLEGTDKATRLLQQAGKGRKGQPGSKPWALW